MAKIDLKNCTLKLLDGRQATLTSDHTNSNADILFTAQKHIGSRLPTVTFTDPSANDATLAITVSGYDIDISLATDSGGTITSTAAQVIAAITASAAASALVTAENAPSNDGTGVVEALAEAPLADGPRELVMKIGEGTLNWTETKAREYVMESGTIDGVRNGDETPMDVSFDLQWEELTAASGDAAKPYDVIKQRGEAASYVTSDVDACQPYSVDIEVLYNTPCSTEEDEYYIFPSFRHETINFDLKAGTIQCSGKCPVEEPIVSRAAA